MTILANIFSDKEIKVGEKFSKRTLECDHPVTKELVKIISNLNYELFVHQNSSLDFNKPIFTLILTMHDANIDYVRNSLDAVFGQTYANTEVILVNNGAKGAVDEMVCEAFKKNKNAKLIRLPQNLYNPVAPPLHDPIPNLWNAGLFCSQGDFVYFMAYDDSLSENYVEKMVALFSEDSQCCTAAPLVVSMDEKGGVNVGISEIFKRRNNRGRYTDGVHLAKSYMEGKDEIVFPGGLLSFKSQLVLDCGGFDNHSDTSQLFKFAIHGLSGFDPEAVLYWRHHSQQTNKLQTQMGLVYYQAYKNYAHIYNLQKLHEEVAGKDFAEEYQRYMERMLINAPISALRNSFQIGFFAGWKAFGRIFRECPGVVRVAAVRCVLKDLPSIAFHHYLPWFFIKMVYRRLKNIL